MDKKSKLVKIGILLILAAVLVPMLLRKVLPSIEPSSLPEILIDLFRLSFFVGVGCVVIGSLRNRKARKR